MSIVLRALKHAGRFRFPFRCFSFISYLATATRLDSFSELPTPGNGGMRGVTDTENDG